MRLPLSGHGRSAVALAAVAMMAAGCGLTDDAAKPGVAAEVEGQSLELSQVDQAVQDYCALLAVNKQATASPTALVRAQFALGWTEAVAVEHLAKENGIELPPASIDPATVEDLWGDLGKIDDDNYDSFEWLTWIRLRLSTPVEQLGAQALQAETGQSVTGDPALNRGIALVDEWLAQHDPAVNPVFGAYDDKTHYFVGDALSVPVSNEATSAVDTGELSAEQVNALPAAQRCGPRAAPVPQVPGA